MSELSQECEGMGITITSQHVGLEWSTEEDGKSYPRDKWVCTLHYKDKSESFDYSTGIGNRVCAPGVKQEGPRKWVRTITGDVVFGEKQAVEKGYLILKRSKKPNTKFSEIVGPSVADVVSSLASECGAMKTTFDDWCSDFGANNDSLKALNTYLACQRNGSKLVKLLGYTAVEKLSELQH